MFGAATLLTALIALTTAAPTPEVEERSLTSGSLTWYTEGMGVSATACGTVHQVTEVRYQSRDLRTFICSIHILTFKKHIAALSSSDYGTYANPNDSPVCGKHIRIHGPNGKKTIAKVVDRCAGCSTGDVDVTPAVFLSLGYATSVGRVNMNWEYI